MHQWHRPHLAGVNELLPIAAVRNRNGYHWFVVGTVCIGAFMAALDASIVNIALPVLTRQFHISMSMVEWVSLVYLLTLAGLIVPFGRIADMIGRRWMYALGFTVFIIGSFACGVSANLSILLISRVIQAVGAGMLQANSVSIITAATPSTDRGKAIGLQASAQGVGLSLGPTIGGVLLSFLGWRWIFFINLPVGILGTILGILLLPKDKKAAKREKFDYLGAALLGPALVALIYFLNTSYKQGIMSPYVIGSMIVFVIGFTAFIFVEKKVPFAMVDLKLFKNRIFSLGSITGILSFAVTYAVLFLSPFYLDSVQHMGSLSAGLYLSIIPLGMTLFTPFSGFLSDKFGSRLPMVLGMAAASIGSGVLALMGEKFAFIALVLGLFLVGTGLGMFTPPNNSSVMGSAPSNRLGVAGGVLNMSRTLGMGLGITLGGLCYEVFLSLAGATDQSAAKLVHMVFAFRWSFIVAAILSIITLFISAVRQKK